MFYGKNEFRKICLGKPRFTIFGKSLLRFRPFVGLLDPIIYRTKFYLWWWIQPHLYHKHWNNTIVYMKRPFEKSIIKFLTGKLLSILLSLSLHQALPPRILHTIDKIQQTQSPQIHPHQFPQGYLSVLLWMVGIPWRVRCHPNRITNKIMVCINP